MHKLVRLLFAEILGIGDISGTLSPKVANWKNLEEFQLIETKIPEEFGMLKNLKHIEIEKNHFDLSPYPEFFRYLPVNRGDWAYGTFDYYTHPGVQYNEPDILWEHSVPKWYTERVPGAETMLRIPSSIDYHYPYAPDLQYPANEYFFDGKEWRHPLYEYPARNYHKVNNKWIYDPNWDWNEVVVPAHIYNP